MIVIHNISVEKHWNSLLSPGLPFSNLPSTPKVIQHRLPFKLHRSHIHQIPTVEHLAFTSPLSIQLVTMQLLKILLAVITAIATLTITSAKPLQAKDVDLGSPPPVIINMCCFAGCNTCACRGCINDDCGHCWVSRVYPLILTLRRLILLALCSLLLYNSFGKARRKWNRNRS